MSSRARSAALLALLAAAGCQGEGSDIGPGLGSKPPEGVQVMVLDDALRAVSSARVRRGGETVTVGRSGRAEMPSPQGAVTVLAVEGAAASAVAGDQLQGFSWRAVPIAVGRALSRPVVLPDLSPSTGTAFATGVQPGPVVIDDRSTPSGAELTIAAGSDVRDGAAPTIAVRTGVLQARHLPVLPPATGTLAILPGRAVAIGPATATFAPAAVLSVPDDFAVPGSGPVDLYRLDAVSGDLVRIGAGTVAGGRITSQAVVDRGGLYVFVATVAATASVTGRVVNPDGDPVREAWVLASGAAAVTADDGTFTLAPLAATDLAGQPRQEPLSVVAGRQWLSASVTLTTAPLTPGATLDLGDVGIDTDWAGTIRALTIEQGRVAVDRRLRAGSGFGNTFADAFAGRGGMALLEDQVVGFYGFRDGRAISRDNQYRVEGFTRLRERERFADVRVFSIKTRLEDGKRGVAVLALDPRSTGPIADAFIVRGKDPAKGLLGRTFEGGTIVAGLSDDDHVTAAVDTRAAGQRSIAAFTTVEIRSGRVELAPRRALRMPFGAFDRHGLVAGAVTGGAGGGRVLGLRSSWPLSFADWFDRVVDDDASSGGSVPVEVAPTTAVPAYVVGVPSPRGHLSATEGTATAAGLELERVAVAYDVVPIAGTTIGVDLPLTLVADRGFALRGAVAGLDGRIAASDLRADYGFERPGGNPVGDCLDLARDLGGASLAVGGVDAVVRLPDLAGSLTGGTHLVCLRGEATVGGARIAQRSVTRVTTADQAGTALLAPPTVTTPTPGSVVPADGFTVAFVPPADADYVTVTLATSDGGSEQRSWCALLSPRERSFPFRVLPPEAPAVLAAGRRWRLTVQVARIGTGPLLEFVDAERYRRVVNNWVSLGPPRLGVVAVASVSFEIDT